TSRSRTATTSTASSTCSANSAAASPRTRSGTRSSWTSRRSSASRTSPSPPSSSGSSLRRSRSSSGTWPASSDAASRSASTRRGSPSRSPTSPSTGETARPSPGPGTPATPRPGAGSRGTSHGSWGTAMAIRFYNTLARSLDEFVPIEPGHVRMYACGPTVYQPPHIGNYRTFLFNDLVHRYLEWRGYRVRFVMNLTDVDDKTIAGAREQGISLEEFTAPVIRSFFRDLET